MLGVSHAFKRNDVREFRIVGDNAYGFGSIDARSAADGEQEVGTRLGESLKSELHILYCRVLLYLAEYLVWNASLVKNVEHFLCNAKLDEVLVSTNQCLVQSETAHLARQFLTCARAKI